MVFRTSSANSYGTAWDDSKLEASLRTRDDMAIGQNTNMRRSCYSSYNQLIVMLAQTMRVEGDKSSSSPASAHQFTTNTPSTHFHALPRTSIEAHMNDDAGCQPVARLLLTLPCVPPALRVCSSPSKIQREEVVVAVLPPPCPQGECSSWWGHAQADERTCSTHHTHFTTKPLLSCCCMATSTP
ncbi:hypothetical protein TcWFU_007819 [Taenia crassiceps]|uniref:Uncharacterized protein n=1 Tax=Taenia crassiceps TaxID=6207 RepID=A0ABR4QC35_9CEST